MYKIADNMFHVKQMKFDSIRQETYWVTLGIFTEGQIAKAVSTDKFPQPVLKD